MARIDVQTLVMAFEKRIELLEKNPPDKVPMAVIINLLEKTIDELIRDHFIHIIQKDLAKQLKEEFNDMKRAFVKKAVDNMLTDSVFRLELEKKLKGQLLNSVNSKACTCRG